MEYTSLLSILRVIAHLLPGGLCSQVPDMIQKLMPTSEGGTYGAPAYGLAPKHTSRAGSALCPQSQLRAMEVLT